MTTTERVGLALGVLALLVMWLRNLWLGWRVKRALDTVNDDLARQRTRRRR